jgi:hypothetical protein
MRIEFDVHREKAQLVAYMYSTYFLFDVLSGEEKVGNLPFSERSIIARIQEVHKNVKHNKRIVDSVKITNNLQGLRWVGLLDYNGLMEDPQNPEDIHASCYSVSQVAKEILSHPEQSAWLLSLPKNRFLFWLDYGRRVAYEKLRFW